MGMVAGSCCLHQPSMARPLLHIDSGNLQEKNILNYLKHYPPEWFSVQCVISFVSAQLAFMGPAEVCDLSYHDQLSP